MKIVDVSTVVVNAKLRNWVFVKIETDEPGLIGWGEATLEWKTLAVCGAVEDLKPLLIGQDADRISHLWQSQFRHPFFKGGVVSMSAISGIDQALWDIKGKSLGVPVWQLIGGNVRDQVRMYDHLGGGNSSAVYGASTPEEYAELANASIGDGFDALKILAVPIGPPLPSHSALEGARRCMEAVRESVGPNVDIMVDLHGRTTPSGAIAYAQALAEYDPWFFEEPCQPHDFTAIAEVARAIPFPVASGERLIERHQFRDVLNLRGIAVAQPDVCHVGGITELTRIAALCETYQVPIAPHNPLGPVATWANLHVAFATPNFLIQEVMRSDVPWREEVVTAVPEISSGHTSLPHLPGLGVNIDEPAAARHPYEPEIQVQAILTDGSVGDW